MVTGGRGTQPPRTVRPQRWPCARPGRRDVGVGDWRRAVTGVGGSTQRCSLPAVWRWRIGTWCPHRDGFGPAPQVCLQRGGRPKEHPPPRISLQEMQCRWKGSPQGHPVGQPLAPIIVVQFAGYDECVPMRNPVLPPHCLAGCNQEPSTRHAMNGGSPANRVTQPAASPLSQTLPPARGSSCRRQGSPAVNAACSGQGRVWAGCRGASVPLASLDAPTPSPSPHALKRSDLLCAILVGVPPFLDLRCVLP